MKDKILKFVEEQVNPTVGEIIAHVEAEVIKEVKELEEALQLFSYYDDTAGYFGETRVCNDKDLF